VLPSVAEVGSFIARGNAELAVRAVPWRDEAVPRELGPALFDAFASREKTLHANAGTATWRYLRSNSTVRSAS
jgi:hypothetical protein